MRAVVDPGRRARAGDTRACRRGTSSCAGPAGAARAPRERHGEPGLGEADRLAGAGSSGAGAGAPAPRRRRERRQPGQRRGRRRASRPRPGGSTPTSRRPPRAASGSPRGAGFAGARRSDRARARARPAGAGWRRADHGPSARRRPRGERRRRDAVPATAGPAVRSGDSAHAIQAAPTHAERRRGRRARAADGQTSGASGSAQTKPITQPAGEVTTQATRAAENSRSWDGGSRTCRAAVSPLGLPSPGPGAAAPPRRGPR